MTALQGPLRPSNVARVPAAPSCHMPEIKAFPSVLSQQSSAAFEFQM